MKVLVVDDDLGSRLVAQAAVERMGHECQSAPDGASAWQLWQTFRPEVLITDRVMPGIDGLELCRLVRDAEGDSYTYIVLLTSSDGRADILTGLEAGADDYVAKPLDPFTLQARLLVASRVTLLHAELSRVRAALSEQAHTDPLTGLRNRLKLNADLARLHENSRRYARPYSVALCDIDFFKRFNDTYGHQAGDGALRAVSDAMTAQARQGDGVYRYGGEEFLVLLPEQSAETAATAMERFRLAILELGIEHSGAAEGILSCSIGLSTYLPGSVLTSEHLVKQADDALYRAKAAGRNRVVATGDEHLAILDPSRA